MLPEDDRNKQERLKCFNVNFRLLKTIIVHLLVCYLNKLQNARCNDKGYQRLFHVTNFIHFFFRFSVEGHLNL